MATPTPLRRHFLTEPDESLTIAPDPVEAAMRLGQAAQYFGIGTDAMLASPMSSVPLPLYPVVFEGEARRWAGTRPTAMWHPLMWLPPKLAGRYCIIGSNGRKDMEEDDLWAVRIAVEMTASGLYCESDGTWLDVLSLLGLSIENTEDMRRVADWLSGVPDEQLDAVDLTEFLLASPIAREDPAWAVNFALAQLGDLRTMSWALSSESLLDVCDTMGEDQDAEFGEVRASAGVLASFGGVSFGQMREPVAPGPPEHQWWLAVAEQVDVFTGTTQELLTGPVEAMAGRLTQIHGQYWPQLEALAAADGG